MTTYASHVGQPSESSGAGTSSSEIPAHVEPSIIETAVQPPSESGNAFVVAGGTEASSTPYEMRAAPTQVAAT